MANDSGNIRVASDAQIFQAPYGTTPPTGMAAPGVGYAEVGFVDENGVTIGRTSEITDIPVMQSRFPARRIKSTEDLSLTFAAREWKAENVILAFGGGSISDVGGGVYKYSPPDASEISELVMVFDWQDGDFGYRLLIPKCIVTETADIQLLRTDAGDLGVTVGLTPDGSGDPYNWFSDDPEWADLAGS